MRLRLVPLLAVLTLTCLSALGAQGQQPAKPTPIDLLREFLERDGRGDRLRTDSWMAQHTIWGPSEAGWDGYMVITSYRLRTVQADTSKAKLAVTYDVAGFVDVDTSAHYTRRPRTETVVFTLAFTDAGWQLAAPIVEPHVLANQISPRTSLSRHDWALLRLDARRVRQSP